MFSPFRFGTFLAVIALVSVALAAGVSASHLWGNYHWARTANPFNLKVGDNVSSVWDAYLAGASSDWGASEFLDMTVIAGTKDPKRCRPTAGRVEVCSAKYGNNGWLGMASVWVKGGHITQGVVKVNDTYFNTSYYGTSTWKNLVMCQEVGHTLGLDHQDEIFDNPNLGTCMDYTSDPDGPPSNEHPNSHDYEQLGIIYSHLDSVTTVFSRILSGKAPDIDIDKPAEWGEVIRHSSDKRASLYERDLGGGHKVFTFVIWTDPAKVKNGVH